MSRPQGHKARKRFGQNFLHDPGVIERIVRAINPAPDDALVEIGPGLGALTEELLALNPRLQVVELDRDLIPVLRTKFFNYPDFRIHEADALKFDFRSLVRDGQPLRIVGNLPYNISTPLIFHLLSQSGVVKDMHFMLQKEVVQRLAAVPGDSQYGRLGIMAQYFCRVQPLFEVGPGAFRPAPKVDSAVVRLVPYDTLPHPARDLDTLQAVVRTAFNARRKTLRKALAGLIGADRLRALGIDDGLRPENLTLADYVRIADALTGDRTGPIPEVGDD
ncbi:16S rRNA (adenine(1518)-N(6)/adenine(1519)-N(6))-dimethyltransferase RsmA [Marinobacter lutaoensis]|jgi:16S rRNA (adenine1518-N6/adenine1519-N6)-dimethyltransferase|uniref:Ribosomal RNA small subunit methyltransferase A n=1 Tax=Marinobacter lutaoensis TaxID=135739 RepID=A0A1V2DSE4_9GAMM|nr:16S rRNA (adenine(1518)-N(6)/adenine(1519)-N(6))-dimethyltransferase RsmA [Marinobacter lutaoensis]MBE02695.1 16S rRNA (adenine(1518)-N(6)/adenine(1519)-N(6))-dimethyltransferase RsmA [Marinobacter sp.]MBI43908.1 16S rRNA (adenine(1518)-N(6)/adenine(1519)-N(6))-dimethyltransferase RsmA [Oceanospirillales bacterium]NVD35979.1 16S rRNA (adenine(1518)-N(6)/adenine(1519)-N(6))-dimethyltransferase RsmA [Marinobacter lutaoensis]ONF43449.1 16S rRNA (adenine(1518)-N(6)/adenine(1519)-N(6))-dimethyltr|tara:strand:- start:346 stop:1173 length:828 start_codon:yes stop_codon:yes gene_type:complete